MQYVPAAQHSQALIAWLNRRRYTRDGNSAECIPHIDRLDGHQEPYGYVDGPPPLRARLPQKHIRLLTPARADAWLREHLASEPMSLLHGVVP